MSTLAKTLKVFNPGITSRSTLPAPYNPARLNILVPLFAVNLYN
jgi:hypothetical protein